MSQPQSDTNVRTGTLDADQQSLKAIMLIACNDCDD
jgi:hypothetical protein